MVGIPTVTAVLAATLGCREPELPPLPFPSTTPTGPAGPVPEALLAASPAAPGVDVVFRARPMRRGEALFVGWSTAGPGDGPCLPEAGGVCFDVADATVLGPVEADYAGSAAVSGIVDAAPGDTVWAQGIVVRVIGPAVPTGVIARPVFDAAEVVVGDVRVDGDDDLPALAGVAAITGELRLEGAAVRALALPSLVQLGGSLVVWESDALDALSLPALAWVAGDVSLYDDPALLALDGLGGLREVGGTLSVNRMAVGDLGGLEGVTAVGGDVYLYHDEQLVHVDGLAGLEVVGQGVIAWELPSLVDLGLRAIARIGGKLDLFEADALTAVALPAIASLGGYDVHECDVLADAGTFGPGLTRLDSLELVYDDGLTSIDGLANLAEVDFVELTGLPGVRSLGALGALTAVDDALTVAHLGALPSVDLPRLAVVGDLVVKENPALTDVGLPAVTEVGAAEFLGNGALPGCAVEAWLTAVGAVDPVCAGNLPDTCDAVCTEGS